MRHYQAKKIRPEGIRKKRYKTLTDATIYELPNHYEGRISLSLDELAQWDSLSQWQMQKHSRATQPALLKTKFSICVGIASLWFILCFYLSIPWIRDLAYYVSLLPSLLIIFSIALIPGFMYMFLIFNYVLDKRKVRFHNHIYPFVSILIAAYNEEKSIKGTLVSIKNQQYPGKIEIILIDDGSIEATIAIAESVGLDNLTIINAHHGGKAAALNHGLTVAKSHYIITLDADTFLLETSLKELMDKLLTAPPGTVACAGSIYVKNTQNTLMTKIQSWDYFLAIAVIKRSQSFLQGTLVAQGAFSVYEKKVLQEVGGWPSMVGEDIVLTWSILDKGYFVDFAEKAMAFTNAPTSYKQFFYQRSRWARGLIEAFRHYPKLLLHPRLSTFYIYWNLCFILFDTIFFFVFIPGVIAALLGYYFIAGPMTLVVIPLGFLSNFIFFRGQKKLFETHGLEVSKNRLGFFLYVLFYQFLMNPSVIHGYLLELTRYKKSWGTK